MHLRNIRILKPFLTRDALITVTHSFITARIDYCNSLLLGVPDYSILRLQRIQNAAARIITGCSKYEHITPVLRSLHWLPVKQRVIYKVLLMTYKVIAGVAPTYV